MLFEGDIVASTESIWSTIDAIGEKFDQFNQYMREEDDFGTKRWELANYESSGTDVTFNSPSESEIINSDVANNDYSDDDEKLLGARRICASDLGRWNTRQDRANG